MKSAVCRLPGTEDGVERNRCGAASPSRLQRLGSRKEYLVRDETCLLLEKVVKAADTEKHGLLLGT